MGRKSRDKQERRTASTATTATMNERRSLFARIRRGVIGIAEAPNILEEGAPNPLAVVNVFGTGFIIDAISGFVVTAGHVIDPWIQAFQEFTEGRGPEPSPPKVILAAPTFGTRDSASWNFLLSGIDGWSRHVALDLAVVHIAPLPPEARHQAELTALPLAPHPCEEGDDVIVCGFPLGNALHHDVISAIVPGGMPAITASFSKGIVSAVLPLPGTPLAGREYFQMDIMINPGNSGGPIVDPATGNVLGVVTSTMTQRYPVLRRSNTGGEEQVMIAVPTGLARGVNIHHVQPLISDLRRVLAQQGR